MASNFHRDRFTWLNYLFLAYYGYFLNGLGPITPFLKDELNISYTVSSLHFTAFAVGILLAGLGGERAASRLGRERALWTGTFGLSLGVALLLLGRNPAVTIAASFFMGLVGSLILVIVPSALSDRHGELRAVALSEANVISSLASSLAPLLVGWAARSMGSWRLGLGFLALAPFVLYLALGRGMTGGGAGQSPQAGIVSRPPVERKALPTRFWIYWSAILLAVSVEFCMSLWSAEYLETAVGMEKAAAAQGTSLFLAAMIIGRLAASRFAPRFSIPRLVAASVITAGAGFMVFWMGATSLVTLIGLFITGLGVAGLYPLILSAAIATTDNADQASARATLASGSAILALPLLLGRLADSFGIRPAYGIVILLLAGVLATMWLGGRKAAEASQPTII